ncbi:MAG: TetR/AcrR family transcriptional regulator, partial [Solirubrobacteraceae bacterium]
VITRDGLAKTTVRAIAREADCSQGILAHYFDDKDDILTEALLMSHRHVRARTDEKTAGVHGFAALRIFMLEALPLDAERAIEAQIEVSFWSRMLADGDLAKLQRSEVERLRSRLRGYLDESVKLGELRPGLDLDVAVHELMVLVDGLSVQFVHDPERVPAHRQLEMLGRLLDRLARPRRRVTAHR